MTLTWMLLCFMGKLVLIAPSACIPSRIFPTVSTPATPSQEVSNVNGATAPDGSQHPGEITFDDKIENRQWTQLATEVPQSLAWSRDEQGWQPVTRIEITGTVSQRRISKFSPDGRWLESTIQAPSRPK